MRPILPVLLMFVLPACIPDMEGPQRVANDRGPPPTLTVDSGDLGERAKVGAPPPPPPASIAATIRSRTPLPIARNPDRPSRFSDTPLELPAPRPVWEARPVTADARIVPDGTYVVVAGDTMSRIAEKTGASSQAIVRANGLAAPVAVRTGQRLTIPGGHYHLVRGGESGIAIARAYGVDWSRIVTANALAEPYILRSGQRLAIPVTAPTANSRAAERAAAFSLDVEDLLTGAQPAQVASAPTPPPTANPRRILPTTTPIVAPSRLAGGFDWPVEGSVVKRFGAGASGERSDGIKIATPLDTPIRAAADGVVAYVGSGIAALGGLVIVKHGDGWASVYGHAARLLVRRGQSVRRGQPIALSGETGFADRPEVHFELRRGRTAVDPLGRLPRR